MKPRYRAQARVLYHQLRQLHRVRIRIRAEHDQIKRPEQRVIGPNLTLSSQGKPADPTIWPDWLRCVERAKAGEVNANLVLVKKT
jgi:hypothetical protein